MKVALICVTGRVGSRLLCELLARGHVVRGIVHTAAAVEPIPSLSIAIADARDATVLAPALVGSDAVISAARFVSSDVQALIAAAKQARVGRLLVVGGAGSLEVAPGRALADSPGFPEAFRAEAEVGARVPRDVARRDDARLDLSFAFGRMRAQPVPSTFPAQSAWRRTPSTRRHP